MDTANLQNKYQTPKLTKNANRRMKLPTIDPWNRTQLSTAVVTGRTPWFICCFLTPSRLHSEGYKMHGAKPGRQRAEDGRQSRYDCAPPPPSSSSASPSASQALVLTRKDLNDIDSRINFLHEIMSAGACSPSFPSPSLPQPWASEVPNNYISFQRLI